MYIIQGNGCHHGHNQNGHIEPSCIIGAVEGIEGGIQNGDKGTENGEQRQPGCPVFFPGSQKSDNAGHGEQGQIAADGGPLGTLRTEQIGSGGSIRNHEKALDNPDDPGPVRICHHIHAIEAVRHPVVFQNGETRGQQQHRRQHYANNCLQGNAPEFPPADVEIPAGAAEQEVNQDKDHLSRKEKVVDHGHQRHCQSKYPSAVVVHPLLQGDQQQGEKGGHILEVVEEDIIGLEAGKGIEHAADGCRPGASHKAPDIGIAGHGGHTVLQA